jgi:hypothetical protein
MSWCEERPVVIEVLDEAVPPRSCDGCGGSFKAWGYARTRVIRERGGVRRLLRPRRVRCAGCRVTHVLLPAVFLARRTDSAQVILAALLAKAGGRGHRPIAAELALPPGTVRGWLRRASTNAERVRARAMRFAVEADPLLAAVEPAGSVLGDALEAVGVAAAAVRRRLGSLGPPLPLAMIIAGGLLHPLRT